MGETTFWDNQEAAKVVLSEMKVLKAVIEPIENVLNGIGDGNSLHRLLNSPQLRRPDQRV